MLSPYRTPSFSSPYSMRYSPLLHSTISRVSLLHIDFSSAARLLPPHPVPLPTSRVLLLRRTGRTNAFAFPLSRRLTPKRMRHPLRPRHFPPPLIGQETILSLSLQNTQPLFSLLSFPHCFFCPILCPSVLLRFLSTPHTPLTQHSSFPPFHFFPRSDPPRQSFAYTLCAPLSSSPHTGRLTLSTVVRMGGLDSLSCSSTVVLLLQGLCGGKGGRRTTR